MDDLHRQKAFVGVLVIGILIFGLLWLTHHDNSEPYGKPHVVPTTAVTGGVYV